MAQATPDIGQLYAAQDQGRRIVQSMRQPSMPSSTSYFNEAMGALKLTPQEQYLYQHHLNNLLGEGKVIQPNGDISTMLQAVVTGPDGKYYNIPTVWDGGILPPDQAAQRAGQVGWDKWPAYDDPKAADARYEQMHGYFERDTGAWLKTNPQGKR